MARFVLHLSMRATHDGCNDWGVEMTTATATPRTIDTTASLQGRARRLRNEAHSSHPLLADTYRRRAAELDLQAWLEAVWNPPMDGVFDTLTPSRAA